ncbi:hypothetical protein OUZ56_027173 [Daphnia magna]|uniref:Uncharacterized protein n=1 Tax=Daphnia magna TaxID=35525 RepID=A0ABQ9ZP37_9CRUS|nr:hypothetical protein OUZ56_027173 [Daphnia magna]
MENWKLPVDGPLVKRRCQHHLVCKCINTKNEKGSDFLYSMASGVREVPDSLEEKKITQYNQK